MRAEHGGQDRGVAGEASGFAGGEGLVGVEVCCLEGAGQDGVVDGDDHGGGGLGVQVVGGEVFEELGESEPAAVPPVEGPVRLLWSWLAHPSGCGHRVDHLGQDAAARAGTVKCPVVVPSPLSCSVSEHLSRAACSSERTSSFSWASTTCWSGSTASIARRATRRSWSGLYRRAFSTGWLPRPGAVRRSRRRQLAGGVHDHRGVPGETSPASRASAVASCPDSSSVASATWRAASERETVVVLASQASGPVNPASFAAPA